MKGRIVEERGPGWRVFAAIAAIPATTADGREIHLMTRIGEFQYRRDAERAIERAEVGCFSS